MSFENALALFARALIDLVECNRAARQACIKADQADIYVQKAQYWLSKLKRQTG